MRTSKTLPAQEETANISPDENQNGGENNKVSATDPGAMAKYPFPSHAGIFSEAARRNKATNPGNSTENLEGEE